MDISCFILWIYGLTVEGGGKKRLSGKFEAGGGGDHDSQPGGRDGDGREVLGGLGGEGMMQKSSYSSVSTLSKFAAGNNIKNIIVDKGCCKINLNF